MIFKRRLLFLTKDRMTGFDWNWNGVQGKPLRFLPDQEGRESFAAYVAAAPQIPILILADFIDEEFRNETQPHVLGPERWELSERRVARAFPATPFRHWVIQERSTEGRKDDITLLTGLTEASSVSLWTDIITEHKGALAGIFSLPLISASLLRKLRINTPSTLFVSQQSSSGLRFSYFKGMRLKMSRMAPVPNLAPDKYTELLMAELEKTRGYLSSLRLLPRDTPLTVVILTSEHLLTALSPLCQQSATVHYQLLVVGAVAPKLGIKRAITTPFSDSLFIQILGRHFWFNHYAPGAMISSFYTHLLRKTCLGAAGLLGILFLTLSGMNLANFFELGDKIVAAKKQTTQYNQKYHSALGQQMEIHVPPGDLRSSVELLEKLEQRRASPLEMIDAVGAVLSGLPDITLLSFQWTGPDDGAGKTKLGQPGARRNPRLSPPSDLDGGAEPSASEPIVESAELKGKVTDTNGDIDHAMARVQTLFERLFTNPACLEIVADVLPKEEQKKETALTGSSQGQPAASTKDDADFKIRVFYDRRGFHARRP